MKRNVITDKQMDLIYQDFLDLIKTNTLTWQQFSEYINNKYHLEFTESAYRKRLTFYQKGIKLVSMSEDKDLREHIINMNTLRLETKKKEIKSLTKELNELKKEYLKNNDLQELISSFVSPSETPLTPLIPKWDKNSSLFLISDMQENGSNWSEEIFEFIYQEIYKRVTNENMSEIWIVELGDCIEGFLRNSDLFLNKESIVKQIDYYQKGLALLLERLSRDVVVNFGIVLSNHTQLRTMGTKANELRSHDITYLILQYLKVYLKNNRNIIWLNGEVQEPLELDYLHTTILNYDFFFSHGHDSQYKPNNAKQTLFNVSQYHSDLKIDYLVYAHYHNCNYNHVNVNKAKKIDRAVIINGALDPRMNKSNEKSAGLNSWPCFTRLVIEQGNGVINFEKINLPKEIIDKQN